MKEEIAKKKLGSRSAGNLNPRQPSSTTRASRSVHFAPEELRMRRSMEDRIASTDFITLEYSNLPFNTTLERKSRE